ncbi:MAG: hypothetical protein ACPG5B_04760 [Chitinophagales bacterium]
MAEPITISTQAPNVASMNYQQLRQEAIEHIQQLAGSVWTDHNTHDPGITMLETLSYAITDLGYRTNYAIEDILASKPDIAAHNFFSPAKILSNRPLTINDYRRLIIDTPAVKNAWLKTLQDEVDLSDKPQLVGLYNVYLELEKHARWGDLNKRTIKTKLYYGNPEETTVMQDDTPRLDIEISIIDNPISSPIFQAHEPLNSPQKWSQIESIESITLYDGKEAGETNGKKLVRYGEFRYSHQANLILEVKTKNQEGITKRSLQIRFDLLQNKYLSNFIIRRDGIGHFIMSDSEEQGYWKDNKWFFFIDNAAEETEDDTAKDIDLFDNNNKMFIIEEDTYENTIIGFLEKNFIDFLNYEYLPKQIHISDIITSVHQKLHNNRNLCEDFKEISIANIQEIAINAKVDIFSESKPEKILAEIIFQLNNFLLPNVKRYTIEELLNQNKSIAEIFEGPFLQNGFFNEQELLQESRSALYVSNIINVIMDNESVVAIKNLSLSHYVEGLIQARQNDKAVKEQLQLYQKGFYLPRISLHKSKLIFLKNKTETVFNFDMVERELEKLKNELNVSNKNLHTDLAIPKGENLQIEEYFSVQNDFSPIYGIGHEGVGDLPVQAGYENRMKRQIQARQLKTYLLFFEQLLANYLQQLANTADLFSMIPSEKQQTYFFADFTELETDVIPNLASHKLIKEDDFFAPKLKDIVENESNYLHRKNKFLTHLLARFSENFVDYSSLLYSINQEKSQEIAEVIHAIDKEDVQIAFKNIFSETETSLNSEIQRRTQMAIKDNIATLIYPYIKNTSPKEKGMIDSIKQIFREEDIKNIAKAIEQAIKDGIKVGVDEVVDVLEKKLLLPKERNTALRNHIKQTIKDLTKVSFDEISQDFIHLYEQNIKKMVAFATTNLIDNLLKQKNITLAKTSKGESDLINDTFDKISSTVEKVLKKEIETDIEAAIKMVVLRQYNQAIEQANRLTQTQLIEQKSIFLQQYPITSGSRGQAFNVFENNKKSENFNLSGFQKRVYLLLDFQNNYVRQLKNELNIVEESEQNIDDDIENNDEFFYVIEHILLRQYDGKASVETETLKAYLLQLLKLKEIPNDFYSMQATIVLPKWPERFRNASFRQLLEKNLRLKAPAHILLYVIWLDRLEMEKFEYIRKPWLQKLKRD